jgi:hypothetical protein
MHRSMAAVSNRPARLKIVAENRRADACLRPDPSAVEPEASILLAHAMNFTPLHQKRGERFARFSSVSGGPTPLLLGYSRNTRTRGNTFWSLAG